MLKIIFTMFQVRISHLNKLVINNLTLVIAKSL